MDLQKKWFSWHHAFFGFWAVLIFATSSMPAEVFPRVSIAWLPKAVHVVYFFVFSLLSYRLMRSQPVFPRLRRLALPLSIVLSVLYALSDETHQMFVAGRTARLSDVVIDASSALLFAIGLWVVTAVRAWKAEGRVA